MSGRWQIRVSWEVEGDFRDVEYDMEWVSEKLEEHRVDGFAVRHHRVEPYDDAKFQVQTAAAEASEVMREDRDR